MEAVILLLGLFIVLALIGLAFMWQGTIRMPGGPVSYGVEESIKYITPRLSEATSEVISHKSVRRILEWEMKYLHDHLNAKPDEPVVLGSDVVAAYVLEQTARQGFSYDQAIVAEVMHLQAEYMESIGALDRPVGEDELKALGLDDG